MPPAAAPPATPRPTGTRPTGTRPAGTRPPAPRSTTRPAGAPPPCYFTDAVGIVHRVYDVRFGPPHHPPHRRSARAPGDPQANYRAFVTAGGEVWLYRFARGESRLALDAGTLAAQRRSAEWAPRETPPPSTLVPGRCGG